MFHQSVFGQFAPQTCDKGGYVPQEGDSPWDFDLDHSEPTHIGDELTTYGEWWEGEGFSEWLDKAKEETKQAELELESWRK